MLATLIRIAGIGRFFKGLGIQFHANDEHEKYQSELAKLFKNVY